MVQLFKDPISHMAAKWNADGSDIIVSSEIRDKNDYVVLIFCSINLATVIYFIILECIQCKDMGIRSYFTHLQNILDFSLLSLSLFYLIVRLQSPSQFIFPLGIYSHIFQTVDPEILARTIEYRMNYNHETRILS